MKIGRGQAQDEPEINLVSLIDVLFCLILFLVLTTSFNQRAALKIQLPTAQAGIVADKGPPLIVMVDVEGRYYVGNTEVLKTDVASLKQAIAAVAGDARDQPVILRADGRTPHQAVVTAEDALGQLGFVHLRIATSPERKP
ncbi:biopolymer transporter ExbD [soil metagenome]